MLSTAYFVRSFGLDCVGNITGYVVARWVDKKEEVARKFVGDLYTPGSFEEARRAAGKLCRELNGEET